MSGLVERACRGRGAALVITAEPGMGRTTLLERTRTDPVNVGTVGIRGIEAESELSLAGLKRLLSGLPGEGGDHCAVVDRLLGPGAAPPANTAVLGGTVRRLLAESGPLLCWIDDAHLVDRASLEVLAFAARRLSTTSVLMVFTTARGVGSDSAVSGLLTGIPDLELSGLDDEAATRVLRDRVAHGVSEEPAEDLLDLACGNPLALVELATSLTLEQAAGLSPVPNVLPRDGRYRGLVRRCFLRLRGQARLWAVMVASEERLDTDTVSRAIAESGQDPESWEEAVESGLVVVDGKTAESPNEPVRSSVWAESSLAQRRQVHDLLATVLQREQDETRWTWHRAAASGEPPDSYAGELAEVANAARRREDYAISSEAFRRSAVLTPHRELRAERLLAAGHDSWLTGRARRSRALIREAHPLAASPELRGTVGLLRGSIELHDGIPERASRNLVEAADELDGTNRAATVTALMLAGEASYVAGDYPRYFTIAQRAAALRRPDDSVPVRLMLDHFAGMAATFRGGHREAAQALRRVVRLAEVVRDPASMIWASQAAFTLGDPRRSRELAIRALSTARGRGMVALVPWTLVCLALSELLLDRYSSATANAREGLRVARATGQHNFVIDHFAILALLAALRGDGEVALPYLREVADDAETRGLGRPAALGSWASACLDLTDGRPADAVDRFRLVASGNGHVNLAIRGLAAPHYVEAAARCGQRTRAARVLKSFDDWVGTTGSAARLALSHRCHALLAGSGADTDEHFHMAMRLHRRSDTRLELAKTELYYGEWLRRHREPRNSRRFFADAAKIFQQYEADHWLERTRTQLRVAGEAPRPASTAAVDVLTPQQAQISRLVARGATNREIAAELFISRRTVDHHLRNVFSKLGVRSRVELAGLVR